MESSGDWRIPVEFQPRQRDVSYDLDRALTSIVSLRANVPDDAFTAATLGTERAGYGVVIRDNGLVLTIGYLVTEAQEIWLTTHSGRVVAGHTLAYDYETGFGLVQPLAALDAPALPLGQTRDLKRGTSVVTAGAGGRARSVASKVVARQEFAGYWEYLLDDAIFTAPSHPHWGGTGLIGPRGDLLGIGSLQLQHQASEGVILPLNMIVPIDLLGPVLDGVLTRGELDRRPRPWLGVFAGEDEEDQVVVIGLAGPGPAGKAGLREGDVIRAVAGKPVADLAGFYRALWALGPAGVDVPLTLEREEDVFDLTITSADRNRFLKTGRMH